MSKSENPCAVERTTRDVIERKLLNALQDGNTVGAVFSRQDLDDMIAALRGYKLGDRNESTLSWEAYEKRCRNLAEGMEQLRREAFPR